MRRAFKRLAYVPAGVTMEGSRQRAADFVPRTLTGGRIVTGPVQIYLYTYVIESSVFSQEKR